MAFDNAFVSNQVVTAPVSRGFRRTERLALLGGASALGAMIGLFAGLAVGRIELWIAILASTPLILLALHLTAETLADGLRRGAYGCSAAAMTHVAALLAWPMTSLFVSLGEFNFFIAPVLALTTLVLFASCWEGRARAVYRVAAQGAIVAAVATNQGLMVLMG